MEQHFDIEKNLDPILKTFLRLTVAISFIVFALKYIAYLKSNSMAIYSDAMESIINIVVSIIALIAIHISLIPADKNHPFGHNKAEYFSATIEGILIIITSFAILNKIYIDITSKHEPFILNQSLFYVIAAAAIQAGWGSVILHKAKKHNSIALRADSLHLLSDSGMASGIAIGLIISYYTKLYFIDYAIAILISLNIGWHGYNMVRKAVGGLMDRGVDIATYKNIKEIIANSGLGALEAHDVKTRVAGYVIFIEFHLVVDENMSVKEAHNICNNIERALKEAYGNARINIHIEPPEEAKHNINRKIIPIV